MVNQMQTKIRNGVSIALATVAATFGLQSCERSRPGAPQDSLAHSSPSQSSPQPTPESAFERDLAFIRNGQFAHIWVFSRKDGHPLDKDDAAYLRATAPQVVDWVTTDDGKRVIAGTNFDLEQGNMGLLRRRFVVEGYAEK